MRPSTRSTGGIIPPASWMPGPPSSRTGTAGPNPWLHTTQSLLWRDFQRQGIATALAGWIEGKARELSLPSVCTEASITARPFFEKRGYRVVQEQRKPHNGQVFVNFVMEKRLGEPPHLH